MNNKSISTLEQLMGYDYTNDGLITFDPINVVDRTDIASEAIAFQTNSSVGKEMDELWKECFKLKDSIYEKESMDFRYAAREIAKLIAEKLPNIWRKNLGFDIKKLIFNTGAPCGCIAIYYSPADFEAGCLATMRGSGEDISKCTSKDILNRIDRLREVAKHFNKNKGKLIGTTNPVWLVIDVSLLFFGELFLPKSVREQFDSEQGFTEREITGILLHEAGHEVFLLERCMDNFYVQATMKSYITQFTKSKPTILDLGEFINKLIIQPYEENKSNFNVEGKQKEDIEKYISIAKRICTLCEFIGSKYEDMKPKYNAKYIDENMKKEIDKIGGTKVEYKDYLLNDTSYVSEFVNKIIRLFNEILFALLGSFTVTLGSLPFYAALCYVNPFVAAIVYLGGSVLMSLTMLIGAFEAEMLYNSDAVKTGDMKGTMHNSYLNERSSDNHAVRHGYGADCMTGLEKVYAMGRVGMNINASVRDSSMILALSSMIESLDKFGSQNYADNSMYENASRRVRRVMQNSMAIFKDKNISAEVRDHYLNQCRIVENVLKKYDDSYYKYDRSIFDKILNTVLSPSEWLKILTTGKFHKEFEVHLNKIEDLSNNTLYKHSASLKSLKDKFKA